MLVGLVVIVAMAALAWMILRFSSTTASSLFNKGTDIQLLSERADGVSEGSPIFYLGVNVGRVMNVRRMANNRQVVVDATIDPHQQPLPKHLVGVIRQQSPLGTAASISLEPDGPLTDETLKSGDQIPARFLGGGVVPPEFATVAREISEQQLVHHVDEAVISVHSQLERMGKALDQVNEVLGDQTVHSDLKATLANLHQTSENLQRFSGRLDELSVEAKATLGDVRTTVVGGGKRFDELTRDVGDRLHQVGDILEKFQGVAAKVEKGEGSAGQLVNDPRLYESLVDTSRELNATVKSLKRLVDQWEQEGISIKSK